MTQQSEPQQLINSIDDEINYIQNNRTERNIKYRQCMNQFKDFLLQQTQQFEETQKANDYNKGLVSQAFESTFDRVLTASDLTIRKIKQTYNQKKEFWDNVIKVNSDLADIELKKEFYIQKKQAEEGYLEAVDRQKDKHKTYKALISLEKKKQGLREYQQQNRTFEEKVIEGTTTLQQWQNISNNANRYHSSYDYRPIQQARGVLNQFVGDKYRNALHTVEAEPLRPNYEMEVENSTSFLNNFQRKR